MRPLIPEVIADEGKSTALVQVGRSAAVLAAAALIKKGKPWDFLEQEKAFEFYFNLGEKRTLDQVAKKLKVPIASVENWKEEYHWDANLRVKTFMGEMRPSLQEAKEANDLLLHRMTMPELEEIKIESGRLKPGRRLIDSENRLPIPPKRVLNPVYAGSKALSDIIGNYKDLKTLAYDERDKEIAIAESLRGKVEDESGKGPKNIVQVNVQVIKS